jgi:hypothetical protein
MLIKIAGRVRGLFSGNYPENREDEQLHINTRGDQVVAQGLPELTELVRMGDSWQVATTTGQAALTALPTTTAGITIKNNESATGKCYAIDSFGSWEAVVDATQTDVTAIFAMLNSRTDAVPSAVLLRPASSLSRARCRIRCVDPARWNGGEWRLVRARQRGADGGGGCRR